MNDAVRVPESHLPGLQDGFAELAKRAVKIGVEAPKLIVSEPFDVQFARHPQSDSWREVTPLTIVRFDDDVTYRRFFMCSVEGSAPVIDGWQLVSVIDHTTDPEIGNLIRNVPGMETPVAYRTAQPICHHCGTLRRRNETFLLLKDSEYKQVGRNCLADFCRSPEMAEQLVHSASLFDLAYGMLGEAGDESEGGSGPSYFPILDVLTITRCLIRQLGWMSKKTVNENGFGVATASLVATIKANPGWKNDKELKRAIDELNADDVKIAEEALAWIRGQKEDRDNLNDYIYNLLVVCSQERISLKHFGLACSLIPTYMREIDRIVEQKLRQSRPASAHFGTVKKREKFTLTVTGMNEFEGAYGITTFVRFIDESGNVAIWKASGEVELDTGVSYVVTGTVKEHSEYKGTKQTVLSRCKCERIDPPSEEDVLREEHNAVAS